MNILPETTFDSTSAVQHLSLLGYQPGDTVHLRFIPGKGYGLETFNRSYPVKAVPWEYIRKLQARGYGVYVAVNGGHCDKDVSSGRALFCEWDSIPKPDQWQRLRDMEAAGFPAPTFCVETRKSIHAYWTLSEPLPVETWKALQAELLRLTESDPTLKNPSRVMRLAGSLHIQKGDEPLPCQLHLGTGQKVNSARLRHGFRQLNPPAENPQPNSQNPPAENTINLIPFLAKNHQMLIETGAKTGSRNARGYALACDLIGVENWLKSRGIEPQQTAYELFMLYCQRCPSGEGWCNKEWEKIWQSAVNSGPKPCCSDNVLSARLKRIVGANDEPDGERPTKKSVAKLLIEIAESECDLWLSNEGDAWADIIVDGVRHSHPVRSAKFKRWLSGQLWLQHETTSNSEAMQSALLVLESKADFGGAPKRPVFLRVGQHAGHIYIDLADERNRAVEVSPQGWRVVESTQCPVRFYRGESQQALPVPVAGGNLDRLWELIPVSSGYRRLVLAWLGFCLIPTGAKPILTLHGPKGAGKSTTATVLKRLVDPGTVDLLPQVGDAQTIATNARHRLILAYDNLSSLSTAQQDTLCRVATGASFAARKLYTDLDETFYSFTRPQILTSVDCVPTRSDLLDRCLLVELDRIDESLRLPESELRAKFDALAPALLGAVLDMVATGLRNLSQVNERLPRMAEFARFGTAALGKEFLDEYRRNIASAEVIAVESNPIASAIAELVQSGDFEGTATQLLAKLQSLSDCPKIAKLTSRGLGRLLSSKALIQDLQAIGISLDSYRSRSGRSWIIKSRSDSAAAGDIFGTSSENVTQTSPKTSPLKPRPGGTSAVGDVCDVSKPTLSDASNERKKILQSDSCSWTKQQKPAANVTNEAPVTLATEKRSLVQIQKPNGETFFNGDMTADKAGSKTSQTSQTSPPRHSGGFTGDIIGDVIGAPNENVTQNVTPLEDKRTLSDAFELERWAGRAVFYEGGRYQLVDVLPVSGFAQITNGGPPFLVPINKIQPVA